MKILATSTKRAQLPERFAQSRKARKGAGVMTENEIATEVVDAAYKVHTTLGPGLLETVYEAVLGFEIARRGLRVQHQAPISVGYENLRFDVGFRADLVVEGLVIVEFKSVEHLHPEHKKQLLTYIRLADLKLGLLLNFGAPKIKDGITRVVNGLSG